MSFDTIRIILNISPILIFQDSKQPYVLITDASKHSWSGMLFQERVTNRDDSNVKSFLPITCANDTSVGSEKNWTILTKEVYTIYMAFETLITYMV